MRIKADIDAYKKGDRAAEMRLAAFITECEKSPDARNLRELRQLVLVGGKIGVFAKMSIDKINIGDSKKRKEDEIKSRIKSCVAAAEAAGIFINSFETLRAWLPPLKEAAGLRWQARPDQEIYNIDLKIRRMTDIARRLGIAI